MPMRFVAFLAVALTLITQLAACGGSSSEETTDATAGAASPAEITAEANPGDWAALKQLAGPYADRLIVPSGPSPDQVVIRDLKPGTGAPIRPGDTFAVRYVDFDYGNGIEVERNWGNPPWRLKWKIGELVDGWEPGLEGIRAGGSRELIVPSRLAYENGPRVYYLEIAYIERH